MIYLYEVVKWMLRYTFGLEFYGEIRAVSNRFGRHQWADDNFINSCLVKTRLVVDAGLQGKTLLI